MKILALDLGSKFGYAVNTETGIKSGAIGNKRSSEVERYNTLMEELQTLITNHNPDVIYYEDVKRHLGVLAAHMYGGYRAIMLMTAEDNNIEVKGVGVQVIKKHWTGKGNAKKEDMVAAAVKRGFNPKDDNEADAIALLHYAMEVER